MTRAPVFQVATARETVSTIELDIRCDIRTAQRPHYNPQKDKTRLVEKKRISLRVDDIPFDCPSQAGLYFFIFIFICIVEMMALHQNPGVAYKNLKTRGAKKKQKQKGICRRQSLTTTFEPDSIQLYSSRRLNINQLQNGDCRVTSDKVSS